MFCNNNTITEVKKGFLNFFQYEARKPIRIRHSQDWNVYAITYRKVFFFGGGGALAVPGVTKVIESFIKT